MAIVYYIYFMIDLFLMMINGPDDMIVTDGLWELIHGLIDSKDGEAHGGSRRSKPTL